MIFTNPVFLFGLIVGAVPVVIHLAGRKRAKTLPFPSLRFIEQINKALARRYKLRELILLVMRVASVCLLALALALPRLTGDAFSQLGSESTSTVFIIDNTLGMNRRKASVRMIDYAKQAAREWIERMGRQERAAVLPVYGTEGTVPALSTDHESLVDALSRIEGTYCTGTAREVLQIAFKALENETTFDRRVVVLSDFAESFLPGGVAAPEGVRVFALQAEPGESANLFVKDFRRVQATSEAVTIMFQVMNAGTVAARCEAVLWALSGKKTAPGASFQPLKRSGREAARKHLLVPPGGVVEERLTITSPEAGLFSLHLSGADDCLQEDNRACLAVPQVESVPVLLVKERESMVATLDETFWLQCALTAATDMTDLETVLKGDLEDVQFENYALVLLGGLSVVSADAVKRLNRYVRNGGTVLLIAGELMELALYRKYGKDVFPLLPVPVGTFTDLGSVSIGWVDMKHRALKRLRALTPQPDLFSVWFRRILQVEEPKPPARVLIRLANNLPLLVEKPYGQGHVLFFAAPMTPQAGNLPLRVAFLPFLDCFVQEAGTGGRDAGRFHCGQAFSVPFGFSEPVLAGPQGEMIPVSTGSGSGRSFEPFETPGYYLLKGAGGRSQMIAVNTPPVESAMQVLPHSTITARLHAHAVLALENPRRAVDDIQKLTAGKDMQAAFVITCLSVLCIEGILAAFWAFRRMGRSAWKK